MKSSHRATKPLRSAQAPMVHVIFFIARIVPVNQAFSKLTAQWISLTQHCRLQEFLRWHQMRRKILRRYIQKRIRPKTSKTDATIALVGNHLFIRGYENLYCIEGK